MAVHLPRRDRDSVFVFRFYFAQHKSLTAGGYFDPSGKFLSNILIFFNFHNKIVTEKLSISNCGQWRPILCLSSKMELTTGVFVVMLGMFGADHFWRYKLAVISGDYFAYPLHHPAVFVLGALWSRIFKMEIIIINETAII